MLHSVSQTTQCYTVLHSVGNEHPLQKGQEVCTCELCFICFQFLVRIFIIPICLYHFVRVCRNDLITIRIRLVAGTYCFKILIHQKWPEGTHLFWSRSSNPWCHCQCIFVWLMCELALFPFAILFFCPIANQLATAYEYECETITCVYQAAQGSRLQPGVEEPGSVVNTCPLKVTLYKGASPNFPTSFSEV